MCVPLYIYLSIYKLKMFIWLDKQIMCSYFHIMIKIL